MSCPDCLHDLHDGQCPLPDCTCRGECRPPTCRSCAALRAALDHANNVISNLDEDLSNARAEIDAMKKEKRP